MTIGDRTVARSGTRGGREVAAGILAAVGDTPLVRLERLFPDARFDLYAKLEALNPAGSVKDRPAKLIIDEAIASGRIRCDTVVVESSSGNLGIGLAQVCRYLGLRFICVVDARTTAQNQAILRAYGAQLEVVHEADPETGELLHARLQRVRTLLAEIPDSFWPNQYANRANPRAHNRTMEEVDMALDGRVDLVVCAVSTCGTLRGCAEYVRGRGLRTRIVAVDAVGSAIFGAPSGRRMIPGHGAALRPALFEPGIADRVVRMTDLECVVGCRTLVWREAILAGGSSGAVVSAVHRMRGEIPAGASCVLVLPDRGERYLETIYSDEWVAEHLGAVPDLLPERLLV